LAFSLRDRGLRQWIAAPAARIAARASKRTYLPLDYPPSAANRPRWGYGAPEHAALAAIVGTEEDAYRASLDVIRALGPQLQAIPAITADAAEPRWQTEGWLPELDAAAIYAFLRERDPAHYVEVGSGNSTRFAARARRDGGLRFKLTSIDPHPRAEIDALCDEVVRTSFETADTTLFDRLEAGDVVFFDGSHRSFMNSDATVFLLEVLPRLPAGVLVGVHDVFLPRDYPPEYAARYYSEQYLLAAYLLGGGERLRLTLASNYVATRPELYGIVAQIWSDPALTGLRPEMNSSFWFELDSPAQP
jgi:hypothetical protein